MVECAPETWDYIVEALREAAYELFFELGPAEVVRGEGVEVAGESVVGVIGYAGDGLRGALLLQASRDVAVALQPEDVREEDASDALLRDVVGELANQLLGRLKNKLASRGALVVVATPITAIGRELRPGDLGPSSSAWLVVSLPSGTAHVRFDAQLAPDLTISAPTKATEVVEGELLIF